MPPASFHLRTTWKYGDLGSREIPSLLCVRDVSPEAPPVQAESRAGVGYLEEVAFFYPLIISTSSKSLGSLEASGLSWQWPNPGRETRKWLGRSQQWLIGVQGKESVLASVL